MAAQTPPLRTPQLDTNAQPSGSSRSVADRANLRGPAMLQMSFHRDRMILTAAVGRLPEDDEQRDHGERRDHQ